MHAVDYKAWSKPCLSATCCVFFAVNESWLLHCVCTGWCC